MSFICEAKKASPSKGLIAPTFPYLDIARDYEAAGAAAISCLTEPFRFLGDDRYLREIAETVSIPVLRKDFTVDEYMIYEARALGAAAVLLIVSLLSEEELRAYRQLAEELGMAALVETHDEREIETALHSGARILGVNNRDLTTFDVNLENSRRLRAMVPPDVVYVAESGIRAPQDVAAMAAVGADAVLVGEMLMRASDKRAMLAEMRAAAEGASS